MIIVDQKEDLPTQKQKKTGNIHINVSLLCKCVTKLDVEKQNFSYFEYLSLALSNHHSRRMRSVTLPCVPCLALTYFSTFLMNEAIFRQEVFEYKMRFLILSTNPARNVSFPKTNTDDFLNDVYVNNILLLSDLEIKEFYSTIFVKVLN